MIFYNTLANVSTSNNTLKILSTWTENGTDKNYIITVNVPVGHYDINGLVQYLNGDGVCNRDPTTANQPYTNYYVGMGVYGNTTYPPFQVSNTDSAKIEFQFPTAGTGGALNVNYAAHVYTGFFLIVDDETKPFLNLLGLLDYDEFGTVVNTFEVNSLGATYTVLGNRVFTGGAATYYTYTLPWTSSAPFEQSLNKGINSISLGSPTSLGISWEQIFANTRTSYSSLSLGDTIAIVPITSAYGYKSVYQPPNPFKCIIPNFNINRFRLKVVDADTGLNVNFQNVDWCVTLNIEFYEIDNEYKSEKAIMGYGRTVHPTLHTTNLDHTLPHSGTGGYKKQRKGDRN